MKQNLSDLSAMSLNNQYSKFIYSDEQLIGLFQSGDDNAYIELVNRYRDRLTNFVFQFLGDLDQAEDVVQDTMIKLYQKKHYYREIAKFSTWIYTIARNLANTELRKRKRKKIVFLSQMTKKEQGYELTAIQPNVEQDIENEFIQKKIQESIQKLPEHFRSVIILRDIEHLAYEDISKIIEVPLGTVKSRINRARLQLQADLQDLKKE